MAQTVRPMLPIKADVWKDLVLQCFGLVPGASDARKVKNGSIQFGQEKDRGINNASLPLAPAVFEHHDAIRQVKEHPALDEASIGAKRVREGDEHAPGIVITLPG